MSKTVKTSENDEIRAQIQFRLKYHPVRIFTYLVLAGISSAFLFLSISYFATTFGTDFNKFKLPLLFHANTVIILASGYTLGQTRKAVMADDWAGYVKGLFVTAGLGVAFTFFQVTGWMELMRSGIKLNNNVAGAYLYLISGLHLVHLIIGVTLLLWFLVKALNKRNDPIKLLLFESNPFSKMKVDLLCTYWHFVDGIWIYFYLFFLFNIYVLAS